MLARKPAATPSARTLIDHKLVREALDTGEEKVYTELRQRYYSAVYNLVRKMISNPYDVEDLTQQAFAKAFHKLSSFNPQYAFATWLFRIATNECIAFLRVRRLNTVSIQSELTSKDGGTYTADFVSDHERNPQEELIHNQKVEIVRKLIEQLPAKFQEITKQYYLSEISYTEIAEELKVPVGTIKARLYQARLLLGNLAKKWHLEDAD